MRNWNMILNFFSYVSWQCEMFFRVDFSRKEKIIFFPFILNIWLLMFWSDFMCVLVLWIFRNHE